jgi:glutaredoxin
MMQLRFFLPLPLMTLLVLAAGAAQAQQLYRWTDDRGRVHITDTPPPASAKDVQKKKAASADVVESAQPSFELAQAIKDFPVVLYTAPDCKEPCARAREALNKRAVSFKEVQVWDEQSIEEVKRLAGKAEVPVLTVGRSVQVGFEQGAYDALLDSARYPKTGVLAPRAQAAPPPPQGYAPQGQRQQPKAEPVAPAAEEAKPSGPYAPGAPRQRSTQK